MDTIKKTLWGEEESSSAGTGGGGDGGSSNPMDVVTGNDSPCPSLGFKQRVFGFVVCTVVGVLMSILGGVLLFFGNIIAFAVLYSIGNLVTVGGTLFLTGPQKQLKSMFDKTRIIATVVWIIALILTLVIAFTVGKKVPFLIIIFVIIQALAFAWYSISYIPFAHKAIIGCVKGIL